ncbi:MAG: hypothetical protein HY741_22835 [Chloroflexi bacterium]|nr:hypothetical protein [Chloroflexota bacterium]
MGIVLMIHVLWRWAVVLVMLVALVKFGLGWAQRKQPDLMDRRVTMLLTTVIDIQVLLGLIVLVWELMNGALATPAIEHVITMFIVVVVVHLTSIWRKRENNAVLRNNFLVAVVTLGLIVLGVSVVGGWSLG